MIVKLFLSTLFFFILAGCSQDTVELHIIETTDVHGRYFNYDFARDTFKMGAMAQVATYVKKERSKNQAVILLDNGDIIQGDPAAYYANYVDTISSHFITRIFNTLQYDAATVGNHDIEAGPGVYNKIKKHTNTPYLAANILDKNTGKPAFTPYTIFDKKGVKIAILGLTTPGIPNWLPEKLYEGLSFQDMTEAAKKWMPEIKKSSPDIIIGLFHSGLDASYGGHQPTEKKNPNATLAVARQVPGFDLIFAGHDHKRTIKKVANSAGDTVTVIDGGSHAKTLGSAVISYNKDEGTITSLKPQIIDITAAIPDQQYNQKFSGFLDSAKNYFHQPAGYLTTRLCPQKALFGPSKFMSFIHQIQLHYTNADVSLSAPLQINRCIESGTIYKHDIFSIYRFENYLATVQMSVTEIDQFLEYAVKNWFNTMKNSNDNLLKYEKQGQLAAPYYNFSSAAGLNYEINVNAHEGERINITKIKNHTNIKPDDTLTVAMNSYRLVGGGGHLPAGVKLNREQLKNRKVQLSQVPIKKLMMDYFAQKDTITIKNINNWNLLPNKWATKAIERERKFFK